MATGPRNPPTIIAHAHHFGKLPLPWHCHPSPMPLDKALRSALLSTSVLAAPERPLNDFWGPGGWRTEALRIRLNADASQI